MVQPLWIYAIRLDLCGGTLTEQLACAQAREPELDSGNSYLTVCCQ